MHLFLYVVIVCIFYIRYATTSDLYTASDHFIDYLAHISKTLERLKNSDFPNSVFNKNITYVKSNRVNDPDTPFSKADIHKLDEQNTKILNFLKHVKEQLSVKYANEINRKFEHNEINSENEHFQEFARQLVDEGRKVKTKKFLMKAMIGLKVLTMGVILPMVLGIALFASWKGVTISLMALLLAGIIALKNIVGGKHDTPQHVIVSPLSNHHQHWWRKTEGPEVISWDTSHELAYSGHR